MKEVWGFPQGKLASGGTGLNWSLDVSLVLCSHICAVAEAFISAHWERGQTRGAAGPLLTPRSLQGSPPVYIDSALLHGLHWVWPLASSPKQLISKPGWPLSLTKFPWYLLVSPCRRQQGGKDVFTLEFVPKGWLQNGLGDPSGGFLFGDLGLSSGS